MVVVTDLEGTLTGGETWRGLTEYLTAQGRGGPVRRFLLPYAFRRWLRQLGFRETVDDRARFMVDLARLMRGQTEADWAQASEWIVEHTFWPVLFGRVWHELLEARQAGARVIICSGAYQPIVAAIARRGGFEALGTPLTWEAGRATGKVAGPINQGDWKATALRELLGDCEIAHAYGDTAADIAMLSLARAATIIDHDPALRREADARGWRILSDREARGVV